MTLKVYAWSSFRRSAPGPHHQTREIVAARSMAAVARMTGHLDYRSIHNLCETGNAEEIKVALAKPGVIHWRGLNEYGGEWRAAE